MARFLVATMPIPGHVAPFRPVVRRLVERGHEVVWYGSTYYQQRITSTGARFAPIERGIDYGDGDYDRHFPARREKSGLRQVIWDFDVMFAAQMPAFIDDLVDLNKEFDADVLLHDTVLSGFAFQRVAGVPAAQLNITVASYQVAGVPPFGLGLPYATGPIGRARNALAYALIDTVVFRRPNATFRRIALTRNWPVRPMRPSLSDHLTLQPSVPEMDYPVDAWPDTFHFIGPLLPEREAFTEPSWWSELRDGRRVVLVTQGTVATASDQLIIPTLHGLTYDEDVLVIAATGGPTAADLGVAVPGNAHVEPFIPFAEIMPFVDAYVTNGGFGGVTTALAHGVPVVAGGRTEDKTEVAARVRRSGVGVDLRTATPTPAQVRAAVRDVLEHGSYRRRAEQVRDAMAGHDAATEAAELLEKVAGRKPAHRY